MQKKPKLDTKQMFDLICDFAQNVVNPDKYSESDKPEDEMQKHFSEYMSKCWSVLREVNIPAKKEIDGCGKNYWEIDETLYAQGADRTTFYITGELKLHTERMSNTRNYCDDVVIDVKRMKYVSHEYFNVPMGFVLFVTCDKEECDNVESEIRNMQDVRNCIIKEKGQYYALIIRIIPQNNEALHCYSSHWRNREEYLRSNNNLKEYYFPRKLK